ncbi:rod shape-determining protein MreC [Endozoicomonadaceae bacterium StTr2]
MFKRGRTLWSRFLVLVILSLALLFVDQRMNYLAPVRSWLTVAVTPVQWLADMPVRLWSMVSDAFVSRSLIQEENARLKAKNLILQQQVLKLEALTAQNIRLKALLNSTETLEDQVKVAEIIGVNPDPSVQQIIINKGSQDGVFLGQAVLDATGVMGQVVEVSPFSSRVMLVTDASSRIPAEVNRSGVRMIAAGTGLPDKLDLLHVSDTADIQEGDLLTSSGMGQRFPVGYPLGKVSRVVHDPGKAFARIEVVPAAHLNRGRLVLLLFSETE